MFFYRAFRTRGVYVSWPAFRRVMKEAMDGPVLLRIKQSINGVVETWNAPPEFESQGFVEPSGVFLNVWPVGPNAIKWNALDDGVPGRVQRSTKANRPGYKPAIRFYKYRPKTFGIAGGPYGKPVFVNRSGSYWWPGIKPKYLNQHVANEVQPDFKRLMENAARRGVRAAEREGT